MGPSAMTTASPRCRLGPSDDINELDIRIRRVSLSCAFELWLAGTTCTNSIGNELPLHGDDPDAEYGSEPDIHLP